MQYTPITAANTDIRQVTDKAGRISRAEAKSRHRSTGREHRTQEGRSRQEEQQARPSVLYPLYKGKKAAGLYNIIKTAYKIY